MAQIRLHARLTRGLVLPQLSATFTHTLLPDVPIPHPITMLTSVTNYVYERRKRLARVAGVVGGLYLVGRYASARISDMGDRVREERLSREKYGRVNSERHALLFLTPA